MNQELLQLIRMPDPTEVLSHITPYEATHLIRQLREARAKELLKVRDAGRSRADSCLRTALRISEALHAQHPDDVVITTVLAAVVKDAGGFRRAGELLAARLRQDCDHYYLNVVGSVLWHGGYQTSARFAFDLARQYEDADGDLTFTEETLETLRSRLRGTWLPDNAFFRLSEEGKHPMLTNKELAKLETPIPIPGLDGYTLRPLKSKRQLARVANQLRNCLNSYLSQVVNGTTMLFAVENKGTPVEAIEVNPATQTIVQWKGVSNSSPNKKTRPIIERVLAQTSVRAEPQATTKTGAITIEAQI